MINTYTKPLQLLHCNMEALRRLLFYVDSSMQLKSAFICLDHRSPTKYIFVLIFFPVFIPSSVEIIPIIFSSISSTHSKSYAFRIGGRHATLNWIFGHIGFQGGGKADQSAKEALYLTVITAKIPPSLNLAIICNRPKSESITLI